MVELPPELLAAFGVAPRHDVEFGAVFYLRQPHVNYFGDPKGRPGVVVRTQGAGDNTPVRAWLFYTTTEPVSPAARRLELQAGDGGLRKDCRVDSLPFKQMSVAELEADCDYIGRLDEPLRNQLEVLVQAARRLPRSVKGMNQ